MVKLVDTPDLGSGAARCVGSSPILGISSETFFRNEKFRLFLSTSSRRTPKEEIKKKFTEVFSKRAYLRSP